MEKYTEKDTLLTEKDKRLTDKDTETVRLLKERDELVARAKKYEAVLIANAGKESRYNPKPGEHRLQNETLSH